MEHVDLLANDATFTFVQNSSRVDLCCLTLGLDKILDYMY